MGSFPKRKLELHTNAFLAVPHSVVLAAAFKGPGGVDALALPAAAVVCLALVDIWKEPKLSAATFLYIIQFLNVQ